MEQISKPSIRRVIYLGSFAIVLTLLLNSCNQRMENATWDAYSEYLAKEENGLVKRKKVKDLEFTLTYLSADYIAYKELASLSENVGTAAFDSLRNTYMNNETYLLTVEYVSTPLADLMWAGISDQQMYQERVYVLSFRMADYVRLNRDGKTYTPALAHYDPSQGLTSKIKLMFVFPLGESENDLVTSNDGGDPSHLDLVFEDPFWNTGLHHFVFNSNDIEQLPALRIN